MTTDEAVPKILSNTYTKTDCYKRILLLQDFLEHVSYGGESEKTDLVHALAARYQSDGDRHSAAAVAVWGEPLLKAFAAGNSLEQLKSLRAAIAALPEFVLYVPVALVDAEITTIGTWCRATLTPTVLIDVRIDPSAVGGCKFVWKDTFYDFSLEYFMGKHDSEMKEMVRKRESTYASG